jgi:hypothetical protein
MTANELPTYHIWHDTPQGRLPFTYFVFGPHAPDQTFDVEIWRGHVDANFRGEDGLSEPAFLGTAYDLPRSTHIVADVWDTIDALVGNTVPVVAS